jgi:hypothetical protein
MIWYIKEARACVLSNVVLTNERHGTVSGGKRQAMYIYT